VNDAVEVVTQTIVERVGDEIVSHIVWVRYGIAIGETARGRQDQTREKEQKYFHGALSIITGVGIELANWGIFQQAWPLNRKGANALFVSRQ
jgi:hypothetical protein